MVQKLPVFTFAKFEESYLTNKNATEDISFEFDLYIKELKVNKSIVTAVCYETAKNSLDSFRVGLQYANVTKMVLTEYETWMLDLQKSVNTISIYLRCLRKIFNRAAVD